MCVCVYPWYDALYRKLYFVVRWVFIYIYIVYVEVLWCYLYSFPRVMVRKILCYVVAIVDILYVHTHGSYFIIWKIIYSYFFPAFLRNESYYKLCATTCSICVCIYISIYLYILLIVVGNIYSNLLIIYILIYKLGESPINSTDDCVCLPRKYWKVTLRRWMYVFP